jgi:hypothetical protein
MQGDDIADAHDLLKRSGWSVGVTAFHDGTGGRVWLVDGRNGENLIRGEGATEAAAWRSAVDQARSVGMLEGWRPSEPGRG